MINTIENNLADALNTLVETHGLEQVRRCLAAREALCSDDPEDDELVEVWHPDLFVNRSGQFLQLSADGFEVLPRRHNQRGLPYVVANERMFWPHVETYRGFVGNFKSDTHMVRHKDGDPGNCHVSNLFLVRKQAQFRTKERDDQ